MYRMKSNLVIPKQPIIEFDEIREARAELTLRDYQHTHLSTLLRDDLPRHGDLSDAGTGKTPVACVYMFAQYHLHGHKTVWPMPKALLRKNRVELLSWSEFNPDEVVIVDGTPEQRKKQINYPNAKVLLCGFQCFAREWMNMLKAHPQIGLLAGDEWHLGFSTHHYSNFGREVGPNVTKQLYAAMKHIPKLLPMTGTIAAGRLSAAYPFLHLINPMYYGTYQTFLHYHAVLDDYGNPSMWLNHERLATLIDKHSVRVSFTDAFGSEPVQIQVEMCSMSPKQQKAYDQMHSEAMVELEDEFLVSGSPAITVMRCRQIMQHPETLGISESDDGKKAHIKAHVETAVEAGQRIVIFEATNPGQYEIVKACQEAGARVGLINGDVSDKGAVDEAFQRHDLDVVVAAPICAGIGFNWGFVNLMIFSSLDYGDTTFVQNYRRAMRGQRKEPLLVKLLQYPKSIDQRITAIVNKKSRDRMKVMRGNDTGVILTQKGASVGRGQEHDPLSDYVLDPTDRY